MKPLRLGCLGMLWLGLALSGARGQGTTPADLSLRGEKIDAYLMTMGVGREVYEKFGHNALWLRDRAAGTDKVYNYGMFSFGDDFLLRFVQGDLRYWMQPFDLAETIEEYQYLNRSVWVQKLNLTSIQRARLQDFLEWNARPENRYYQYDYYLDNCSTRIRDALDNILDGQLKQQTAAVPTGTTFRFHNRRSFASDPAIFASLEFIVGQRVDRPISRWQEMYLPLRMMEHVQQAMVTDDAGRLVPLAGPPQLLIQGQPGVPDRPGRAPWLWFLLFGLLLGAALYFPARALSRRRLLRWGWAFLAIAWTFLAGGAGTFLAWSWLFTRHWAVRDNENLLLYCPLSLAMVVLIPLTLRGSPRARRIAPPAAALLLAIGLLDLLLKPLPVMSQQNATMLALCLPIHAGLAAALWRMSRLTPPMPARKAAPPKPVKAKP